MDFSRDYLEKLAGISTPEWRGEIHDEIFAHKRSQQCYDYCQLRNAAKDLLDNLDDNETKKKLSKLIKKLEISIE